MSSVDIWIFAQFLLITSHAAYKILLLLSGQLEAALQESGRSAEKNQIRADF